jgi:anti-anti-sigma factor
MTEDNRDVVVAITTTEIDLTTAEAFDTELDAAVATAQERKATRLTLDFGAVHFLDSGGISRLIDAGNRLREVGCRLEVSHVQRPVGRVFDVLGLTTSFAVA